MFLIGLGHTVRPGALGGRGKTRGESDCGIVGVGAPACGGRGIWQIVWVDAQIDTSGTTCGEPGYVI